jgi:hypothetical protein
VWCSDPAGANNQTLATYILLQSSPDHRRIANHSNLWSDACEIPPLNDWAERRHDLLSRAARRAALATNANWPSARWERRLIPYLYALISKNDRHGARRLIHETVSRTQANVSRRPSSPLNLPARAFYANHGEVTIFAPGAPWSLAPPPSARFGFSAQSRMSRTQPCYSNCFSRTMRFRSRSIPTMSSRDRSACHMARQRRGTSYLRHLTPK